MNGGAPEGGTRGGVRLGLTLPSFSRDVAVPLDIAARADDAGLDAVFGYDHMFRVAADGSQRPALECFALLSAVAQHTERVAVGALVVRTSLRPAAVVVAAATTLEQLAPGRVIIGLGAGDSESRPEHEQFGVPFPSLTRRIELLRGTAVALTAAAPHIPVWIGGRHHLVLAVVDASVAWNVWGVDVDEFTRLAADVRARVPTVEQTWGGLVVLDRDDAAARRRAAALHAPDGAIVGAPATVAVALARFVDAGATTLVLGPVDAANPANVELAAEVRALLQQ